MTLAARPISAHDCYESHAATIADQLARLQAAIEVHKLREQQAPRNWGYAGDLAHVKGKLEELLQFLGA